MSDFKNIEPTDLTKFSSDAYFNYSMYVILDRALPSIQDGLKPVQRRVLYAMNELGIGFKSKHKKSARTIGDVLGKFHPHGDTACYEAMVIMAQPFNYLNPLIDGQGNWGSQDDPKSFAAMRYTEARLTSYAETMMSEIKQDTVPFKLNFDGTLEEPVYLPSQIPNILLNHSTGIAIGMSTEIPSHNIVNVVDATKAYIDNPNISVPELLEYLKGPDLACGGIITNSKNELISMYETGHGSIRVRAKYHIEGNNIVFTEIPFRVQGTKVIESIANLMNAKKLFMVEDIRDESDYENPVRIVISVRKSSKIDIHKVAEHICSETNLETTLKSDFRMIGIDGVPQRKGIITILEEWCSFRHDAIKRRFNYRLKKVNARLHLIDALLIAFLNIDRVIEIIRNSESAKQDLISEFNLSEIQADYIMDTKLRQLARLEEISLNKEKSDLENERNVLIKKISSSKSIYKEIKKDMDSIIKQHGTERVSEIKFIQAAEKLDEGILIPSDPITVIISEKGWVRAGKGHDVNPSALQYKTGDSYSMDIKTGSNKETIFMDNKGRSYSIPNKDFPSARSLGDPITTFITPMINAKFISMFSAESKDNMIVSSSSGYGFVCEAESFYTRQKKGKVIFTDDKANVLPLVPVLSSDMIGVITKDGNMLCFGIDQLPELKKGKGNKLISLSSGDEVLLVFAYNNNNSLVISGTDKEERWTPSKISPFLGSRGRKGKKIPRTFGTIKFVSEEK